MPSPAVHHFLTEWARALMAYERADQEFTRITRLYMDQVNEPESRWDRMLRPWGRLTQSEARHLARQDPRRKDADSDRQHYATRASMYALAAIIELLRGPRSEETLAAITELLRQSGESLAVIIELLRGPRSEEST